MDIVSILQKELSLKQSQIENAVRLIDEGNTIPFIARYRKEATGNMSDVELRNLNDRLNYLRNLQERKEDIKRLIDEQGKLTPEIESSLEKAQILQEVEDIYLPYKKKKKTRAVKAREKGLQPLADEILAGEKDITTYAQDFVDENKEINSVEEAIAGAKDIIAENISDDADLRKFIRENITKHGMIVTKIADSEMENDEANVYQMYNDYSEAISRIVAHRVLAINRGEKEGFLKVKIESDFEFITDKIASRYLNARNRSNEKLIKEIVDDSFKRLIFPSIEREIRNSLTEAAHERAISVFGKNVDGLLMQPPIKGKVVMGFDPAYRTGCKIAVVDESGKLIDFTTIYPTKPQNKVQESAKTLTAMIKKHGVDIISIGNGTASRESEKFVADMIAAENLDVQYVIVSEAGASVYSASELANEEHPDINVSIRGAISIARRLQDPMAELVKIDPKSIGVGQYQHDLNSKRLEEVVGGVVEDAVNRVGVDVNTASASLMQYVSGLSKTLAKNIVLYREENGQFKNIDELKKVKRLGPAAFKQSSGFFRINGASNPLDNTGVHPENYSACKELFKITGLNPQDFGNQELIRARIDEAGIKNISEKTGIGEMTLNDIIEEISKPGRDIRDQGIMPVLRKDVLEFDDIQEGMILTGTVRNVVDFGAFVDVGIKNDGLIHVSEMVSSEPEQKHVQKRGGKKYYKKIDPMDILSVGDIVEVKVIGKDEKKKKISLSMKTGR